MISFQDHNKAIKEFGGPKKYPLREAKHIAGEWTEATHGAWREKGYMFEKYNAFEPNEMGGGGEYVPQTGFGWTNGVSLSFLLKNFEEKR